MHKKICTKKNVFDFNKYIGHLCVLYNRQFHINGCFILNFVLFLFGDDINVVLVAAAASFVLNIVQISNSIC